MVRRQTRVQKRNRRQKTKRNNRRQNKTLRRKRQSRRKGGGNYTGNSVSGWNDPGIKRRYKDLAEKLKTTSEFLKHETEALSLTAYEFLLSFEEVKNIGELSRLHAEENLKVDIQKYISALDEAKVRINNNNIKEEVLMIQ